MEKFLELSIAVVVGIILGLTMSMAFAHCGTLDGSCAPSCGDSLGTCKVEPANENRVCDWLSKHPESEHTFYLMSITRHCAMLGGEQDGKYCNSKRGVFAVAPNLRAIFGTESMGKVYHSCSDASGIPADILAYGGDPQDKEWIPSACPHWEKWSVWAQEGYKGDAYSRINPQQNDVPNVCVSWSL